MQKSFHDGCFVAENNVVFSRNDKQEKVFDLNKKRKLKGDHNLANIMAAISGCRLLDIDAMDIREAVVGFTGLEHRMEYVGESGGIHFYNDSIATIPEACMEAVKALGTVDTLILGGFDRGIDYSSLAKFLATSGIRNFIFTGEAGARIKAELEPLQKQDQQLFSICQFDEFFQIAIKQTKPGAICLLSPAAASYNEFQNFEMRGKRYKQMILGENNSGEEKTF
jgi:UDP-N-acetylmuramoylalanine--D-glutamate ligase